MKKMWLSLMSILLVFTIILTIIPTTAFAESKEEYIQSVKLAQASDSATAKKMLEAAGYTFVEGNLNEGTGKKGVWLGFKTTTNPEEAIYDMKLMNMKGGFTLTSLEKALEAQRDSFQEMAMDLQLLIEEFVAAYEAESVPAQKAYMALNFFRMVDKETELKEENGLGYQLVKGTVSTEELTNILLLCDSGLVDSIIKILTMGIQLRNGNWMEKLSELGPYDSEKVYSEDEDELKRRAQQLLNVLQLYSNAYNGMEAVGLVSGEFDEQFNITDAEYKSDEELTNEENSAKKMDESRYKMYKVVFDEMAGYTYGLQTLKDFFCSLAMEGNAKKLYPLVSVLSDGEFAALSYGCFLEVATGASAKESDFDSYDEAYESITQEAQSVYLYAGVNELMLEEDTVIGFTDAASRHMSSTGEMEFYEKESGAENSWETGKHVATIVGAIGLATMGLAKITMGVTMFAAMVSTTAAASIKTGALAAVMKFCAAISGMAASAIVAVVVVTIVLITLVVSVIKKAINDKIDWDANPIPEYLYDVQEVGFTQTSENDGIASEFIKRPVFVFYEGVRDLNGNMQDLNVHSGDATQWISMYVSYDRQGDNSKPIRPEDILVKTGNGETPDGYEPLSRFGEVVAYDLNQWDGSDKVNGVYVFYKQDKPVAVESNKTYYIYDVYLQQGESDAHCKQLLEAAGYTPLNVNLSPDLTDDDIVFRDNIYTYLGYKVTTNASSAITDLRMIYGPNQGEMRLGAATYAECGSNGTVTLYATKFKSAGTPILAGGLICVEDQHDAPKGYEPVNFFAGGPAVPINVTKDGMGFDMHEKYLYFLPSTTFINGYAYLGGLSYFHIGYIARNLKDKNQERYDTVLNYLKDRLGYGYIPANKQRAIIDYARVKTGYTQAVNDDGSFFDAVVYYETFNPYRAIYEIKGTEVKNTANSFVLEGSGFTLWNRTEFAPNQPTYQENYDFFFSFNEQSQFDNINMNGKLFVAGNPNTNNVHDDTKDVKNQMKKLQPIRVLDINCIEKGSDKQPASTLKPITDLFTESHDPVYLKNSGSKEFALYVNMDTIERPYVASITAIDELTLFRNAGGSDAGFSRKNINNEMMIAQLAAQGATNFCDFRAEMLRDDGDNGFNEFNAMKFGYTRSEKVGDALTDIFFYFNGFSADEAPKTMYRNSTKYNLLCEIPYNLTGYDGAPKTGVYLYGTTDDDVGDPIIDFTVSDSPFMEGYETVRTLNGRSLFAEIRDYTENYKDNHDMSKAKSLFGVLYDFFKMKDSWAYVQENGPFYFHIKRQGDDLRVKKPYVEQIYVSYNSYNELKALDDIFDKGAEVYIDTNLNQGAGGKTIYMGYSYTADPTEAIKEIRAYHKKNPPATLTDSDNRTFTLVSDLNINKDAGGNQIYFYTTKESATADPISALKTVNAVGGTGESTQTWADGREFSVNTQCTKQWDSTTDSNLNDDAGGKKIYLMYTTTQNAPEGTYEEPNYGKEKTYTRKATTGMKAKGKYIGALYVMDKNTIRQEKLATGIASDDCTCEKITDQEVLDRLTAMGATTVIETPILMQGDSYAKNNQNKVFIGYSRTDDKGKAIRNIKINVQILSLAEPPENIDVSGCSYKLVAQAATKVTELPHAINLIGLEDKSDMLAPRMYLYTTIDGNNDPIRDISIGSLPIKNGWTNVRSANGVDPFVDVVNLAKAEYDLSKKDADDSNNLELVYSKQLYNWMDQVEDTFDIGNEKVDPFFIHYKNYDAESIEEIKPYIGEVYLAQGDSKIEALANLAEFEPDGFYDRSLNDSAGGKWVFLGYKRVADKEDAVTDLLIKYGKSHDQVRVVDVTDELSLPYELVAPVDLNAKAGGKYLYLYYIKSDKVGNPIIDFSIPEKPVNEVKCGIERVTTKRVDGSKITNTNVDLNKGAGGKYLYLVMIRETEAGHENRKLIDTKEIPATCGKNGSLISYYQCLDCGALIETEMVIYNDGSLTHKDSETDGNHTCDVCGKKDVSGHINGEIVKEDIIDSTCVAKGSYHAVMYCTDCNKVLRDTELPIEINPDNHFDGSDDDHHCDLCGALTVEDHTPGEPKEENRIEPTEDAEGSYIKVIYCSECGEKLSEETVVIPIPDKDESEDTTESGNDTEQKNNELAASLFGDGSVIIICSFFGLAVLAAIVIYIQKKKKDNKGAKNDE